VKESTKSVQPFLVEPAPVQAGGKLAALLASRKFWAAAVGLALVVAKAFYPDLPLDGEQVTGLVYVVVAYILGVAIEDGGRAAGGGDAPSGGA
jgi:hypothetical protein